jgi:hypothetical protein
MPYDEVMSKFKRGQLHSGSKSGPKVTNRKQAVAIMLSEKRAAQEGKKEYQPVKKHQKGGSVDPDAAAIPFKKGPSERMFPQVPSDPAVRKLSPDFPSKQPTPRFDYPSHSVAVKKGGVVKPGWRK